MVDHESFTTGIRKHGCLKDNGPQIDVLKEEHSTRYVLRTSVINVLSNIGSKGCMHNFSSCFDMWEDRSLSKNKIRQVF